MPNIPEEYHHCWTKKCEKCGVINRGCIRFKVFCYNCNEPIIIFDSYEQSNLKDLFISPEAIKELKDWMPTEVVIYENIKEVTNKECFKFLNISQETDKIIVKEKAIAYFDDKEIIKTEII